MFRENSKQAPASMQWYDGVRVQLPAMSSGSFNKTLRFLVSVEDPWKRTLVRLLYSLDLSHPQLKNQCPCLVF